MEFPVDVALAELVPQLPTGSRWWYEVAAPIRSGTLRLAGVGISTVREYDRIVLPLVG
ncbi:hypothetical protein ACGH7X_04110 [Streptomyces sp. BBFR51]|uniref:hypothetical protein n=1 Tax=Streptomyces sp. BBFR51 TaxID=3372856 RepID=UPI0037DDBF42